jgi:RNA polymerase sigma-70 factor (ECF subfamily)
VLPRLDSAFNLARWLTRNNPDSEDLVPESVLRAFRSCDRFHGTDARPWLLGIVRNTLHRW